MSKTTRRYGKPLYVLATGIDANPKPSSLLKNQWAKLDSAAVREYGKSYDALSDNEQKDLHYKLHILRKQRREREARREEKDFEDYQFEEKS